MCLYFNKEDVEATKVQREKPGTVIRYKLLSKPTYPYRFYTTPYQNIKVISNTLISDRPTTDFLKYEEERREIHHGIHVYINDATIYNHSNHKMLKVECYNCDLVMKNDYEEVYTKVRFVEDLYPTWYKRIFNWIYSFFGNKE
jgi:hypothetical protein